jgi:hypothetical protein
MRSGLPFRLDGDDAERRPVCADVRPCVKRVRRPEEAGSDGVPVPRSVGPADVGPLMGAISRRLRAGSLVACDVRAVTTPDAATIDALARIQLRTRQLGGQIVLRHACRPLVELIDLAGLGGVLPAERSLRVEPGRKSEQRKETLGVEEERDRADPIA